MNIPNDPIILLSFINTKLRDFYTSLDALCEDLSIEKSELISKLGNVGYNYDETQNQFR